MAIKSTFIVTVLHDGSIKQTMCDLIGSHVWQIPSVENTSAREAVHVADITSNLDLIKAIEAAAQK